MTDTRTSGWSQAARQASAYSRCRAAAVNPATGASAVTIERKERTIYFSALRNGETENFFGSVVGSSPVNQALNLRNVIF